MFQLGSRTDGTVFTAQRGLERPPPPLRGPTAAADHVPAAVVAARNGNVREQYSLSQMYASKASSGLEEYQFDQQRDLLGYGTYGTVYKAVHRRGTPQERTVALKKIKMRSNSDGFPMTSLREMICLYTNCHPNVVRLLDVIVQSPAETKDDGGGGAFYMVFEFCPFDLTGLIHTPGQSLSISSIKSVIYQILQGLKFLKDRQIMHRDLKCANILISAQNVVKLADFGLAINLACKRPRTSQHRAKLLTPSLVTLNYRAPEILFGSRKYTFAVDIWSVGCILGECLRGQLLFPGRNEFELVSEMYRVFGTVTEDNMPGVGNQELYPEFRNFQSASTREVVPAVGTMFRKCDPGLIILLRRMMTYNPIERITVEQALAHPCFREAPFPDAVLVGSDCVPPDERLKDMGVLFDPFLRNISRNESTARHWRRRARLKKKHG